MADLINGGFELFAGLFVLLNVRRILIDKQVHGVSVVATSFFTAWGFWNLYFYPSLGQWLSFFGGLSIVSVNAIYVGLLIYYSRKPREAFAR